MFHFRCNDTIVLQIFVTAQADKKMMQRNEYPSAGLDFNPKMSVRAVVKKKSRRAQLLVDTFQNRSQ